jgi:hypothetical protein
MSLDFKSFQKLFFSPMTDVVNENEAKYVLEVTFSLRMSEEVYAPYIKWTQEADERGGGWAGGR